MVMASFGSRGLDTTSGLRPIVMAGWGSRGLRGGLGSGPREVMALQGLPGNALCLLCPARVQCWPGNSAGLRASLGSGALGWSVLSRACLGML